MRPFFRNIVLLMLVLVSSHQLWATHIVGGTISYEHLAGNQYRITLEVYRDCGSTTGFDDPASVGVFDDANNLVTTLFLGSPIITPVNPPISNPCLIIPPGICVEQGIYTTTYTVPSGSQGYTFTYERCCRNGTISNLVSPGATGSTYTIRIPPTSTYANSSPTFTNFPPLFICQNAPLVFNHSATDVDGDSLYYSLCDPYVGASSAAPAPSPPAAPPYTLVSWLPPYSASDPLGGVPLNIDPNSGVLLGTPSTIGQFVVGVCVQEFRGGTLLSTTLRDFQFNVSSCNIPTANIPSTNIDPVSGIGDFITTCSEFTVNFINSSSGATSYQWDFGDPSTATDVSTATSPSYTYPDTGSYLVTLIATNSAGCKDTTAAWVYIYPFLIPDFDFDNICNDTTMKFEDATTFSAGNISSWLWNFGDGTFGSGPSPDHLYTSAGNYSVTLFINTDKGCSDNVTKTVTVHADPIANFTGGPVCEGDAIVFDNISVGSGLSYAWEFGDATPGSGAFEPSHTYATAGNYTVQLAVESPQGCSDTLDRNVTVHALPNPTVEPSDTIICEDDNYRLTATGGVAYAWSPAASLSNSAIANPIATPTAPTTYTVTVTDINGCENTTTATVSFHAPPPVEAGPDTSVCFAPGSFVDSAQFFGSGGIVYDWSPAAGLNNPSVPNPVVRPPGNVNTTYYLTVTDTNGCQATDSVTVYVLDPDLDLIVTVDTGVCSGDTLQLDVLDQGASGYLWSPSTYISDPNIREPLFFPPDTTMYILSVANYCYVKDDSVTVNIYPLPKVGAGNLDSICIGESYQLLASGALTYTWDPDPTLSAWNIPDPVATPVVDNTYFVTGTDTLGCSNRDSITILVHPLPNAVTDDAPAIVCLGDTIMLNAAGGVSYQWDADTTLLSTTVSNPLVAPVDTNVYWVTVTNIHGCTDRDSVLVNTQLPITAWGADDKEICQGDEHQLNVGGGLYYQWWPTFNISNPNIPDPVVRPDTTTTYYVDVANDCFSDTVDIRIYVNPLPPADAGPDDTIYRDEFTYLDGSAGDGVYDWAWFPYAGLDDPFIPNPQASPFNTTDYILFVTDDKGCIGRDTMRLTVIPYTVLLVPTGFSPNGDGVNDLFHIVKYLNIDKLLEFNVFNRWGNKVFSTTDIDAGWDGTYNGANQELGVFAWYVKAVDYEGNIVVRHGTVTLLR